MGSTRIRGNRLRLQIGSTPSSDYWADCTSVALRGEDSEDTLTFEDAANGGARQYYFEVSATQSTAKASFWRYLYENTGEVVAFTYAPHGNETATEDQPHFIGTLRIGPKPDIGGEASIRGSFTFDTRLDVETGPTMDIGD